MNHLFLLSILVLAVYLIWVRIKYGMTHSISATYPELAKAEKWLFGTMWVVYAAPLVLITTDKWIIAAVLMLALVIANPNFWDKEGAEDDLHFIGSYGTIAFGFTAIVFMDFWVGIVATSVFALICIAIFLNLWKFEKIKNETYWQEVIAATAIPILLFFIY